MTMKILPFLFLLGGCVPLAIPNDVDQHMRPSETWAGYSVPDRIINEPHQARCDGAITLEEHDDYAAYPWNHYPDSRTRIVTLKCEDGK